MDLEAVLPSLCHRRSLSHILNRRQNIAAQEDAQLCRRAALILEFLQKIIAWEGHLMPSTADQGAFLPRSIMLDSDQPGLPSDWRNSKNVRVAMKFSEA